MSVHIITIRICACFICKFMFATVLIKIHKIWAQFAQFDQEIFAINLCVAPGFFISISRVICFNVFTLRIYFPFRKFHFCTFCTLIREKKEATKEFNYKNQVFVSVSVKMLLHYLYNSTLSTYSKRWKKKHKNIVR